MEFLMQEERKVTEFNNANEENEMEHIHTVELELEDGTTEECEVLDIIEVEGKSYVALLPLDKDEYYVYGVREEGDEIEILNIDDEVEYEKVITAFEQYFDEEEEFDEDDDDDDFEDEDEDLENDDDDFEEEEN